MLVRIIACALLAGLIAGGASALMQQALVVPVLLEAEAYESGEAVHFGGPSAADAGHVHDGGEAGHDHGHGHGAADGEAGDAAMYSRHLVTAVMTIALNVGFALILLAGFFARDTRPSLREGMVWGVCGFVAFMAAPAAGLAPELPGMAAADLEARQLWWAATVAMAAGAMWLIAFVRAPWALPLAIALLAVPHIVGAPHPEGHVGPAPPELGAEFAARVLAVGLASWVVLGAVTAWTWRRQGAEES